MDDVLTKPFRRETLAGLLAVWLSPEQRGEWENTPPS
jgi:hypothetical protein